MTAPYAGGARCAIARVESFAAVRSLHERLARAAAHPFAHPAWLARHWHHCERDAELLLHVVERDGTPIALLPLARRDDRTIRFVADRLSDVCGPICAPADLPDALDALRALLDRLPTGDVFVGGSLPSCAAARLGGGRVTREASPLIEIRPPSPAAEPAGGHTSRSQGAETGDGAPAERASLPPSWTAYLSAPAARRRRRMVRQAEALFARPDVVLRDARTPAAVARDLDVLARLHGARFASRSRVFAPARLDFFRAALPALAGDGLVSLRTLSVAGRDAAALLLFRPSGEDWFYQAGWDPAFAPLSVGRALFADAVRRAFAEGRRAFRLLRGAETYKAWWATDDEPVVTIERPTGASRCV